jgi:hypothetical protein
MGCIRVDKITEYLCDPLHRCLKVRGRPGSWRWCGRTCCVGWRGKLAMQCFFFS